MSLSEKVIQRRREGAINTLEQYIGTVAGYGGLGGRKNLGGLCQIQQPRNICYGSGNSQGESLSEILGRHIAGPGIMSLPNNFKVIDYKNKFSAGRKICAD